MSKLLSRKSILTRAIAYISVIIIAVFSIFLRQVPLEANTQTTFQRPPFSIGIGQTYDDNGTVLLTGFIDPRNLKVNTYFEYGLNTNFVNKLPILGEVTTARDIYGRIPNNLKNQVRFVRFCGVSTSNITRCSNAEIVDVNKLEKFPEPVIANPSPSDDPSDKDIIGSENGSDDINNNEDSNNDPVSPNPDNDQEDPNKEEVVSEIMDPKMVARTEFLKSIGLVEADPVIDWFTVVTQYVSTYSEEGGMVVELNNKKDALSPGEYNSYRVAIGNGYASPVKDATLIVILPDDVSFISADYGVYVPSRHSVIYSINEINPNERISYFIHTQADIKEGNEQIPQLAVAEISFTNPNVLKTTSVASYDVDNFYPNVPEEAITPVEDFAQDLVAMSFGSNTTSGIMIMMLLIIIVFIEAVILIHELNTITKKRNLALAGNYLPVNYQNQNQVFSSPNWSENNQAVNFVEKDNSFSINNLKTEKEEPYFGHLGF